MPVVYLPGTFGSSFGPNGGQSITSATSGLVDTLVTGAGHSLFGKPKTQEELEREAELAANQSLYGAEQVAQTGLDAPNAPWRTNPADALDRTLFDTYQTALASGASPEVLQQIKGEAGAIKQQFDLGQSRQKLVTRMQGVGQLDPDAGAAIESMGLIEAAQDPNIDPQLVAKALYEVLGQAEDNKNTMLRAQAKYAYLDQELQTTYTPDFLANNPDVMDPDTGEMVTDPDVKRWRDRLTQKKLDLALEGIGLATTMGRGQPAPGNYVGAPAGAQATPPPEVVEPPPGGEGEGAPPPGFETNQLYARLRQMQEGKKKVEIQKKVASHPEPLDMATMNRDERLGAGQSLARVAQKVKRGGDPTEAPDALLAWAKRSGFTRIDPETGELVPTLQASELFDLLLAANTEAGIGGAHTPKAVEDLIDGIWPERKAVEDMPKGAGMNLRSRAERMPGSF